MSAASREYLPTYMASFQEGENFFLRKKLVLCAPENSKNFLYMLSVCMLSGFGKLCFLQCLLKEEEEERKIEKWCSDIFI